MTVKDTSHETVNVKEINKKIIFLRLLNSITFEQQMQVRVIRNEPNIRTAMYTDHEISINEHRQWLDKVKVDKKQIVFVVMDNEDVVIGLASVNAIDLLHSKADWAFYLTSSARGGLGAALEWSFLEFVFNKLNIQKLNCEVIEGNDTVVRLHNKFMFVEEGFRRSNIIKNGVRIGVHFLGLIKSDWLDNRSYIFQKYESVLSKFDVRICFEKNHTKQPLLFNKRKRECN